MSAGVDPAAVRTGRVRGRYFRENFAQGGLELVQMIPELVTSVVSFAGDSRGPRLFRITATPAPGTSVEDVEAAVYAEIERVKSGPIEDWEIEKARNTARRSFVGGLQSSLNRAIELAEYALVYDNPGEINTRYQRLDKLNAADVQRVAKQYLTKDNRSVVVTNPKPAAGRGGL